MLLCFNYGQFTQSVTYTFEKKEMKYMPDEVVQLWITHPFGAAKEKVSMPNYQAW